uniref:EF-hand domain-containing protein n=1 Tax=Oryza punctata TaxID=4537 RepID=A0A0E0JTL4_ORYPU
MKLSIQSFARKLSLPSPKRTWSGGSGSKRDGGMSKNGSGVKRAISRSEASSFASASSSSSSDDTLMARSTPRSVLPAEISRRELEAVLRRLGHGEPSDDELDAVAAIAAEAEAASEEDELMEAFKVFDADGDGRITAEELRGVMVAILGGDGDGCSLDDCRRMIGGVDADGDGFVGFQDFAGMMMAATATADGPRSW